MGGILGGFKSRRTVWIVAAIELPGESSSRRYEVPKGVTQETVRQARERFDPRMGYVGEWHSCTDDSGPSATDRTTRRALAWFVGPVVARAMPPAGQTEGGWLLRGRLQRLVSAARPDRVGADWTIAERLVEVIYRQSSGCPLRVAVQHPYNATSTYDRRQERTNAWTNSADLLSEQDRCH